MVDRNSSMSAVHDVFSELKEASLLNVLFAARPLPSIDSKLRPASNGAHATWFSIAVLTVLICMFVFCAARREKNRRRAALNRIYRRSTQGFEGNSLVSKPIRPD